MSNIRASNFDVPHPRSNKVPNPSDDLQKKGNMLESLCKDAGIQYNKAYPWIGAALLGSWATQTKRNEGATLGESLMWGVPMAALGYHGGKSISKGIKEYFEMGRSAGEMKDIEENLAKHIAAQRKAETHAGAEFSPQEYAQAFVQGKKEKLTAGGARNMAEGMSAHMTDVINKLNPKVTEENIHHVIGKQYGPEFDAFVSQHAQGRASAAAEALEHQEHIDRYQRIKNVHDELKAKGRDPEIIRGHIASRVPGGHDAVNKLFSQHGSLENIESHPLMQSAMKRETQQSKGFIQSLGTRIPFKRVSASENSDLYERYQRIKNELSKIRSVCRDISYEKTAGLYKEAISEKLHRRLVPAIKKFEANVPKDLWKQEEEWEVIAANKGKYPKVFYDRHLIGNPYLNVRSVADFEEVPSGIDLRKLEAEEAYENIGGKLVRKPSADIFGKAVNFYEAQDLLSLRGLNYDVLEPRLSKLTGRARSPYSDASMEERQEIQKKYDKYLEHKRQAIQREKEKTNLIQTSGRRGHGPVQVTSLALDPTGKTVTTLPENILIKGEKDFGAKPGKQLYPSDVSVWGSHIKDVPGHYASGEPTSLTRIRKFDISDFLEKPTLVGPKTKHITKDTLKGSPETVVKKRKFYENLSNLGYIFDPKTKVNKNPNYERVVKGEVLNKTLKAEFKPLIEQTTPGKFHIWRTR